MKASHADLDFLNRRELERHVARSDYAAVGRLASEAVKGEFTNQHVEFLQMNGNDSVYQTRDRTNGRMCLISHHRDEDTFELMFRMPEDRRWWTSAELYEVGLNADKARLVAKAVVLP